jgi:outer membrane receptor protein involved in Fe transport
VPGAKPKVGRAIIPFIHASPWGVAIAYRDALPRPRLRYYFPKRFFPVILWLFFLFWMPGAGAALAAKDLTQCSLEDLMNLPICAASRYEQRIADAPADVTLVTRDEIIRYGYRTLADLLRSVRGFYITYDRNYSYVGVRGFNRPGDYNTRFLVMVDGHRLNDNIYDSVLIGRDFPVDLDLVDRVEIVRGPGSSLYGTNAFLAVINVITRRGQDLKGFEVAGDAGSFNSYSGRLSYGQNFPRGLEVLASGTYYNSRGPQLYFREFDAPATNSGIARNCDYEQMPSFFAKLTYNNDLTLTGVYNSREKGVPTGTFDAIFNDPRTKTLDSRFFLDLKYQRQLTEQWRVMARVYYDRYD